MMHNMETTVYCNECINKNLSFVTALLCVAEIKNEPAHSVQQSVLGVHALEAGKMGTRKDLERRPNCDSWMTWSERV